MRLRHVCAVVSAFLVAGVITPAAFADSPSTGVIVGGAAAPTAISSIGATGATGVTGSTGSTGSTGATGSLPATGATIITATGSTAVNGSAAPAAITAPLAPIVLGKGQSPRFVYSGPVYVQTAGGTIVPYVPVTMVASVSGGTVAGSNSLPHLLVPGRTGEIVNGIAAAPEEAPVAVQDIIWTANEIIGRPYVYGGGHRSFISHGYDCSGTVSYALHGAGLLRAPLDSGQFMSWGRAGQGEWMTILTNPGHAYLDIAGLRLDTSAADDPTNQQGPRWRPLRPANPGFTLRHPAGF